MLSIHEIQKSSKGKIIQEGTTFSVKGVSINSRTIKKGDLFIAIRGNRFDGHRFVPMAIKKGARALVVSKRVKAPKRITVILVKDTTKALGLIAHFYRCRFNIPVIAITGSAGKTTTKEMIARVLQSKYRVLKNKGSENNQFGVPLTIFQLKKHHQILVVELGTNQFGDIAWLASIAKPSVAVFTNIGETHLLGLKTKAGVFREKFSLVKYMPKGGTVIFNNDDGILRKISSKRIQQKRISYGVERMSRFQAKDINILNQRIIFKVKSQKFTLPSIAKHNIYNSLAAISCGSLFKIAYNNISTNITHLKCEKGRFNLKRYGSLKVIDDTYNANPLSLKSAIDTLGLMHSRGKRIVVCADMLELGNKSKSLHEQIGKWLVTQNVDCLFTFGHHAKYISTALGRLKNGKKSAHFNNRSRLHQKLKDACNSGDVVLVKGSRSMQMEQTVQYLKRLRP